MLRLDYYVVEEATGRVLSFSSSRRSAIQRAHTLGEPIIIKFQGEVIAKVRDGKVFVSRKG